MEITFYSIKENKNDLKRDLSIASSAQSLLLKEESDLLNLHIIIDTSVFQLVTANKYNYCYINDFISRYYFINDIIFLGNNLVELVLKCDTLFTYKNDIMKLSLFVERSEKLHNDFLTDEKLPITTQKQYYSKQLGSFDGTLHTYITVNGGTQE